MTSNEYQKLALRTEKTPELVFSGNMAGYFTGMMRAAVQVGHMQDIVKKHVIYGKEFNDEEFGYRIMALDETSEFMDGSGDVKLDLPTSRVVHAAVGVVTEAGELQEMVDRCIRRNEPIDRLNLKEELGDILWYVALAADAGGLTLQEVMERNIEKLEARYKGKFTSEAALNRNLEKEKVALEGRQAYQIDIGDVDPMEFIEKLKKHLGPDPVDVARTIPERLVPGGGLVGENA